MRAPEREQNDQQTLSHPFLLEEIRLGIMCATRGPGAEADVSILCAGEEAASEEERERMDDGLEVLGRAKVSMVGLRRTTLFRRPVHLFFGLAPLFMLGNEKNLRGSMS